MFGSLSNIYERLREICDHFWHITKKQSIYHQIVIDNCKSFQLDDGGKKENSKRFMTLMNKSNVILWKKFGVECQFMLRFSLIFVNLKSNVYEFKVNRNIWINPNRFWIFINEIGNIKSLVYYPLVFTTSAIACLRDFCYC